MPDLFSILGDDDDAANAVEAARSEIRYVVTDFSFELLIRKFREDPVTDGDIYIPEYQRKLAWTRSQMSYFVESLLLRVPVPPIFFFDVKGRLEVVDGSQRLRTMVAFANSEFRLEGLEKLDVLNGYRFQDLPRELQRRLNNTPVRAFVLDESTGASDRADMFRRLNTSGQRLQDAEVRKGVFPGPFLDLVLDCATSSEMLAVTPVIGGRGDQESERQELVTRFFVYLDRYNEFRHDVRKFLDAAMGEFNSDLDPSDIGRMRDEFTRTMRFIAYHSPNAFYRANKSRIVPRVRFEAISVGTALALRVDPKMQSPDFSWLESDRFAALVRTDASNSGPKLRGRIEFVRESLLGHGQSTQ